MKPQTVALVLLLAAASTAHAETKTIILERCTKVETAMESAGGPPTMSVKCTGETTGGPKVRAEPDWGARAEWGALVRVCEHTVGWVECTPPAKPR